MIPTENHKGRDFARLEETIGYTFNVPDLLIEALNHSSATGATKSGLRSYERLEFLGDRVLGLVIAQELHDRFPDETVGDLARRHAMLVRRDALDRVARVICLPDFVRMSRGEEDSGGRENPALLADACEALIAAIYLDGGLDAAAAFITRRWLEMIEGHVTPPRDPKTALQEWLQARGLLPPGYREVERTGPAHAPTFRVEVTACGYAPVQATGPSKRSAERAAAQILLRMIEGDASQ
ncbi:MAG: ribonuclease III [Hyphomicrobiales bacterium]|nr:ribonuclease III [Hyphomicrobiales bacterium]